VEALSVPARPATAVQALQGKMDRAEQQVKEEYAQSTERLSHLSHHLSSFQDRVADVLHSSFIIDDSNTPSPQTGGVSEESSQQHATGDSASV